MLLKIGRHEYDITNDDIFKDDGSTVQLMTQSKERRISKDNPKRRHPIVVKSRLKEIEKFDRIQLIHNYNNGTQIFRLDIDGYMESKGFVKQKADAIT